MLKDQTLKKTRTLLFPEYYFRICQRAPDLSEFAPRAASRASAGVSSTRGCEFGYVSSCSELTENWGRGSGGVKSTDVSQSVRETSRDQSQRVPSPEKLFKTRDLGDLSQLVGRTPGATPVPLYTRTSPWPKKRARGCMFVLVFWGVLCK